MSDTALRSSAAASCCSSPDSLSLPSGGAGGGEGGGSPGGQSRVWTAAVEVVQEQMPSKTRKRAKRRRSRELQPVRAGGRGEGAEEEGTKWVRELKQVEG